uniref:Uncharacterized protein n=1 Tax=Rhizophagus irregularis (strain DAOM 181602 / DAOM 197198 / MUCL 43194) TaxID=747089 RepID=U9UNI2_RHIID
MCVLTEHDLILLDCCDIVDSATGYLLEFFAYMASSHLFKCAALSEAFEISKINLFSSRTNMVQHWRPVCEDFKKRMNIEKDKPDDKNPIIGFGINIEIASVFLKVKLGECLQCYQQKKPVTPSKIENIPIGEYMDKRQFDFLEISWPNVDFRIFYLRSSFLNILYMDKAHQDI